MSRWTLYRKEYHRRQNALLLLTLSGTIRSGDVEVPYLRETRFRGLRSAGSSTADPVPQVEQSLWSMDLRQIFSKNAR